MRTDAELVAGVLAGDREAFAAVYDRYADRLYDFCVSMLRNRHEAEDAVQDTFVLVAQRLAQLNDPERLRPWLYAVARSVALRRLKSGRRIVPDSEVAGDMPDDDPGPQRAAELAALRELVWTAAGGLSERDRSLLDLHLRHGLEGAELGEAMGISTSHAYVLLTRLRDQVERSLGALLLARLGRKDCPDLNLILSDWDGEFTPLLRKRVARHVDSCENCGEKRRTMVSPIALLAGIPILTAPLYLRQRVLDDIELVAYEEPLTGTPSWSIRSRLPLLAGAAALLLIVGIIAMWGQDPKVAGSALAGGLPVFAETTTPEIAAPPLSTTDSAEPPTTTTTPPATTTTPTTTTQPTTTTSTTTAAPPPPPPPRDTIPPQITKQSGSPPPIGLGCPKDSNSILAAITDNIAVTSATVHWTTKQGQSGAADLSKLRDGSWSVTIGPWTRPTTVVWHITATDAAGNVGTGRTDTFDVVICRNG